MTEIETTKIKKIIVLYKYVCYNTQGKLKIIYLYIDLERGERDEKWNTSKL